MINIIVVSTMIVTPHVFLYLGITMISKDNVDRRKEYENKLKEKFRGSFGVSIDVASHVWEYLFAFNKINNRKKPIYLLWALFFMKTYATEAVLTQIFGCSEKKLEMKYGT
jgi:hypothetical protein